MDLYTPQKQVTELPATGEMFHWRSAWQFGISLLAFLLLWGLALLITIMGLVDQFVQPPGPDATPMLLMAAGLAFFGLLIIPSIAYPLGRLIGRPFACQAGCVWTCSGGGSSSGRWS